MFNFKLYLVKKALRRIRARVDYRDIQTARRGMEHLAGLRAKKLSELTYEPRSINGVESEWIIPENCNRKKVLLYFHGGGYATGSIKTHRALVSDIIRHSGVAALLINYRLAPENKYPAPLEDAALVYQWLLENGYQAKDVAFGGDSAGGGVTMGTLLYIRDQQIALPKCAIALSPWLDLTCSGDSFITRAKTEPMLAPEGMPYWAENYIGDQPLDAPYASPVFADLTGLPPLYIQVGDCEVLLNDSTRFAERAKLAGVDVELDIYPKLFHVFQALWSILPEARAANIKLGAFLKKQLN